MCSDAIIHRSHQDAVSIGICCLSLRSTVSPRFLGILGCPGLASPPPHRTRDSVQRGEHSRGSGRRHDDDRSGRRNHEEDRGYSSRYSDRDDKRGGGDERRGAGDDRRGGDRREYSERDRERERAKDRDRYDRRRDGEGDRDRRRSASPRRRSSRPLSPQRSGSRSLSPASKAKPDFAPSGLLAAETNTVRAVNGDSTVLKYNEPPEARKPILGWRLYVFKGSEQVELLHIHRQSAYLFGRDRLVADVALDHPSCSKQHAVIQYRFIQQKDEFGVSKGSIKPFVIDLESTNGTHVNDQAIPVSRYYELKASDVIKFGQSTREYVLLHDEAT
ncbi:smad nuclear interacting protein 1 [Mycena alexandri]|uniref:Smad nuclear interacting protein 1 n=1 Tax=Mycena alexandri TaxID=1745969 RepID=A0AAD6SCM0_9AGAR|nr:smad nuclear interacting protein 1 [Mycena alexandri]